MTSRAWCGARAREVRRQLIDELHERHMRVIRANSEVDRQRRQAERERVEAAKRQRANVYSGIQVSAPGETPPDWLNMPSSRDDE
jgi:hypothetical protein